MLRREIDWSRVDRVLVVRLRSIGDTVLSTPSLAALRRFLPEAQIDILLEDWVAPILDGFEDVDNVITVGSSPMSRLKVAEDLRRRKYDVAFNIHGGTTATFFTAASRAPHRVGYQNYQYSFLYNHLLSSPANFWKRDNAHSAEQQLALLGFVGIPVEDRPRSRLVISNIAVQSVERKFLERVGTSLAELGEFALIHPAAAFKTKEWPARNFSRTIDFVKDRGLPTIALGTKHESGILEYLRAETRVPVYIMQDLTLPEVVALTSKARIFVGNDSGIAHIAAAVNTPSVVIFGSSSRDHWRPWTHAPYQVVYEEFHCQPCAGYECKEFGEPRCILTLPPERVYEAIDRVLEIPDARV